MRRDAELTDAAADSYGAARRSRMVTSGSTMTLAAARDDRLCR